VTWVMPGALPEPGAKPRRAGPRVLNASDPRSHNRDV
jgi:hypothetical protein